MKSSVLTPEEVETVEVTLDRWILLHRTIQWLCLGVAGCALATIMNAIAIIWIKCHMP